ncbi:glycine betaine ABC transporter substrate-binding protein [Actinobacteria bacterium YIM 96077]|uniref:Glycine/betaine ABC transporter substrate-binding protein n=1 Tax=Phytoactinopolyspora halophila TaxID=1981511 RepID=A0A329R0P7_9ACTN|nr:glycine betaine ABC transporter substrate-binding protein [Phytoactinopolyspora halophila]AYY11411.1 glycine betaine ABC transporter substrate-binding protein [Actinobacteria bacterium YIM 96077]RAW18107.1 glycine/betaine ABC transporter substrate-binding protein [Phytoactinopolyspora halophila]
MRRSKLTALAAGIVAGGLVLAACGDDESDEATTDDNGSQNGEENGEENGEDTGASGDVELIGDVEATECDPTAEAAPIPDPEGTGEDETEITIGIFSGWDENYVVYELAKAALEEQGYTVNELEAEAGPVYTGVADGDLDLLMDAWLPGTHGDEYIDVDGSGAQLGHDLENLGCWFDEGYLTIAVNEDSPAQSLDELADYADEYGATIVGIDPGAGLTRTTEEEVIPTYGLEDWEFPTSSSGAMLAELESAMDEGENIVVTLWHPHWAYAAYDIRDLEDPEGTLGEAERLFNLGRTGFSEDYPNAAQLMKNLHLTNEQLLEIEDLLVVEYDREQNEQAVQEWLDDNPEFLEDWRQGNL